MYRKRAISNLLVLTAIVASMGTDCLAQAGVAVRAEAAVSVAEKMAARFTRAFPGRVQQPMAVAQRSGAVDPLRAAIPGESAGFADRHIPPRLAYLPPPAIA